MPRMSKRRLQLQSIRLKRLKIQRLKREQNSEIINIKTEQNEDLPEELEQPLHTIIKVEPEFIEKYEPSSDYEENDLDSSSIQNETEVETNINTEPKYTSKRYCFTVEDLVDALGNAIDHHKTCKNAHLNIVKTIQDNLNSEYPVYCFSCQEIPFVINAGSLLSKTRSFGEPTAISLLEDLDGFPPESHLAEEEVTIPKKINSALKPTVVRKSTPRKKEKQGKVNALKRKQIKLKPRLGPNKRNYMRKAQLKVSKTSIKHMNPSVLIMPCDNLLYSDQVADNRVPKLHPIDLSVAHSAKYRCKNCDINFANRASLKEHRKSQHRRDVEHRLSSKMNNEEDMFKCSCGKYYLSLEGLQVHERTHTVLNLVLCEHCGESFQFKTGLYNHKRVKHSEILPCTPICKICGATFSFRGQIGRHMRRHHPNPNNPKSFMCEKCGTSFKCQDDLYNHQLVHRDETLDKELFRCKQCGILLKNSRSLRRHMLVMHRENQKLISCVQCGKTTKNMTNMRIHMKVHDPNRILKRNPPTPATDN